MHAANQLKVLFVCSGPSEGEGRDESAYLATRQAFIFELSESLKKLGVNIDFFLVRKKGISGYLWHLDELRNAARGADLIHAFYGLSGCLAALQKRVPTVISYLGSDINVPKLNLLSSFACALANWRIFVSKKLYRKSLFSPKNNFSIIPFGVDLSCFRPINKSNARKFLDLDESRKYVLFSSSFGNPVKNYALAAQAISLVGDVELVEMLKGRTRAEVSALYSACDLFLMTSFNEGSPQVIKEAMACNCPIVSTDVGDVGEVIGGTEGCYITSFDPGDVARKIEMALSFKKGTKGRENIRHLEINRISKRIIDVYEKIMDSKEKRACRNKRRV